MAQRQQPLVVVVFAGGPHTAPRVKLAEALIARDPPDAVYLTGKEFTTHERHLAERVHAHMHDGQFFVDPSMTTWQSCQFLAEEIPGRFKGSVQLIAITSNYHRPRLLWLLRAVLPRWCHIDIRTSPDVRMADLRRNRTARKLIRGEIMSWLYCLPLGMLLRFRRP